MPRKPFTKPRGLCSHCDRETALLSDGRINSQHYPCPGAGLMPKALVTKRVVPVERDKGKP
jgi:hypothetical protein